MNIWILYLLLGTAAYIIGSISPARMIGSALLPGQDLGNTKVVIPNSEEADIKYRGVSATSVGAKLGPKWGMAIGVLDMLKGLVPVLATFYFLPDTHAHLVVAAMIMAGHNWPIFYRFHGGRGQSSLIGSLLVIDWLAPLVTYPLGMAIGLLGLKEMFVAYTLGQYLLIAWFLLFGTTPEVIYAVAINVIYTIAALPEARDYLQAKKNGQVGKISSLKDVLSAHPAMGEKRFEKSDD